MKTIVAKLVFTAALVTAVPVSAADDITPVTRSESEIVTQWETIVAQLEKVRTLLSASAIEADLQPGFKISIDEETVVNKPTTGMTRESAQAQCEAIAYNTDHMWKLVTCTFAGETIYQDVFIAG